MQSLLLRRRAPVQHDTAQTRRLERRVHVRVAAAPPAPEGVEGIEGVRPEVQKAIAAAVGHCLTETDLVLPNKRVVRPQLNQRRAVLQASRAWLHRGQEGKVRDTYDLGDRIVVVTTDRQSAFDRLLASIPFKGQVLNQTAAWWFEATRHIVANAVLSVPDPNVTVMKKASVFPVEFVVRGYMTGSTDTSLWTHYQAGAREYCGNQFPDGMRKNQRLAANVITPTTKSDEHDEPISPADIVGRGLMSQADWEATSQAALALFAFGQAEAAKRGLLLVDTKYEFGKDVDGNIVLIDEIHTPDSSRYWLADTYEARHAAGQEPQNIDKEFLRLWFRAHCDPYADPVLPEAPRQLVEELSRRYVHLYERITGQAFQPPSLDEPTNTRIARNLQRAL